MKKETEKSENKFNPSKRQEHNQQVTLVARSIHKLGKKLTKGINFVIWDGLNG
jgi:uncharacterized FlaG/YvyC family protein